MSAGTRFLIWEGTLGDVGATNLTSPIEFANWPAGNYNCSLRNGFVNTIINMVAPMSFNTNCAAGAVIDFCITNVLYCLPEVQNETIRQSGEFATATRTSDTTDSGRTAAC
jgi:hypothetical protein